MNENLRKALDRARDTNDHTIPEQRIALWLAVIAEKMVDEDTPPSAGDGDECDLWCFSCGETEQDHRRGSCACPHHAPPAPVDGVEAEWQGHGVPRYDDMVRDLIAATDGPTGASVGAGEVVVNRDDLRAVVWMDGSTHRPGATDRLRRAALDTP